MSALPSTEDMARLAKAPAGQHEGQIDGWKQLKLAAETFCTRVEAGEIRSKRSYNSFKDALTSIGSATPTAQEAVACLHGYCDAENCPACSQDQEVAQPTEDELDEAWKSGFNAGFGEAKLTAHPPQPSVSVAEAAKLADAIEACDWSGSPIGNKMILRAAVKALRALKGDA